MFTLSGAHVFPMYDGAVKADPPMRILDVRHEQTAAFAAEATGKLTRVPGLAVLTAGPASPTASARSRRRSSRAPRWWSWAAARRRTAGAAAACRSSTSRRSSPPITKDARTIPTAAEVAGGFDDAFRTAGSSHRGPVFVDIPMDEFFNTATASTLPAASTPRGAEPDTDAIDRIARLLADADRPVLILGTDVWADGAEREALELVESAGLPAITNGMGRGVIPGGHPLLVTKARGKALNKADLVVVVGTPLDFRLGYGVFGGKEGAEPARVVHVADSPGPGLRPRDAGRLRVRPPGRRSSPGSRPRSTARDRRSWKAWVEDLQATVQEAAARDAELLTAEADPIHPARIYGELLPRLADDAVVIGDGGDFVSFAGKYVEPQRPGGWLDPGPYGCLGAGLGSAIAARLARPSAQVALLLGDGAAGFSLMDVDTLVRHDLPVVMVMGNNSAWGLEKGPMQMIYGYDVAADLGAADALRRGGQGARRCRRAGDRPAADRARPRPRLRRRARRTSST